MGKLIYRSRKRGKKVGATDSQSPSGASRADVEVWTMDEHRLQGSSRCCRMCVGFPREQPVAQVNCVFSGYGCMFTLSQGETYWWILPKVNINLFNRVLAGQTFWPGKNKQIILAMDQAGWHKFVQVEVPEVFIWVHAPIHQNFNQQSVCL